MIEQEITGKKWQRFYRIEITNNYNETPKMQVVKEEIIEIDGEIYKKHIGARDIVFNPKIPLYLETYNNIKTICEQTETETEIQG